jgi:hypothetical protein
VKQAAEGALGKPCEMLAVTYEERSVPALESLPDERITVVRIRPDGSEWKGNDAAWRALLQGYFG